MTFMRRMEEIGIALERRGSAAEELAQAPRWKLVGDWASVRRRDVRDWNVRLGLLGYCDVWELSDPEACRARV